MQFSKLQLKILQGMSGGAFGLGIALSLIGSLAFNSEDFYHDDKLGMEFGMELDPVTQDTTVWMKVPQVLLIKTSMANVFKTDENGENEERAGLSDLFPITGPSYGRGEAWVEILAADDDQMPDLSTHDQNVKPMAYVSEKSKFPMIQRYSMIGFAFAIKHWTIVKLAIYASAVAMIILGFALRRKNKQKIEADLVVELKGM